MKYRENKNKEKTNVDIKNMSEKLDKEEKNTAQGEQAQEQITEEMAQELDNAVSKENELEAKLAESSDKYIRLAAEFDNYRRRAAKERLDLISTASEDVIKGLLPILDDCERALQVLRESNDTDAAKEGTELILNKMQAFLKSKGLEAIDCKDKGLDTDFHEAIAQFPAKDKAQKNKIIEVVQTGYTLNGKVIRFAKVVVGI